MLPQGACWGMQGVLAVPPVPPGGLIQAHSAARGPPCTRHVQQRLFGRHGWHGRHTTPLLWVMAPNLRQKPAWAKHRSPPSAPAHTGLKHHHQAPYRAQRVLRATLGPRACPRLVKPLPYCPYSRKMACQFQVKAPSAGGGYTRGTQGDHQAGKCPFRPYC